MNIVATIMENADSDTDVLQSLDRNGDRFAVFRDVDFLLCTPDQEKAALVAGFINDHSFGRATNQDNVDVLVTINMPVEQPVALCVSGFFAFISQMFGIEYDGWGCAAQPQT